MTLWPHPLAKKRRVCTTENSQPVRVVLIPPCNLTEPPWDGPVCLVVWEGGAVRLLPIPIDFDPASAVTPGSVSGRAFLRRRIGSERNLMQRGDDLLSQERQRAHHRLMREVPIAADQDEIPRAEVLDGRG